MNNTTRFVILFEGRTGSSMLGGFLNQNPRITCLGEEVAALQSMGWAAQREWIETLFMNPSSLKDPRIKESADAIGFKVKLREIASADDFKQTIESRNIRVIHMTRSNLIKQVVSSIRAVDLHEKTGVYNIHVRHADAPEVPGSYSISPSRFDETLKWLEQATNRLGEFVESIETDVFTLTYEDVTSDTERQMALLCGFLGVPEASFRERTKKITSDNLAESVSNYEELRSIYEHTPYFDMF